MTKFFSASRLVHLIFLLEVGMAAGCEKIEERDPCLQPRTVSLRAGTYRRAADTGTAVSDTALPLAIFLPIGGQTGFAFSGQRKFSLFLSPHADSCQYILVTDTTQNPALRDTLTFRYSRRTQFLSNACGYTYFFALDSVAATTNRLDSVRTTNIDVTNDVNAPEHLRIYYAR